MGLHAVGAADEQNRAVQHRQRPLGFRGKIHMARRVYQGKLPVGGGKQGLLGENGDASDFFQSMAVQTGVTVVNTTQRPPDTGGV